MSPTVSAVTVSVRAKRYASGAVLTTRSLVSDPTVSRQHAQLTCGPDGWEFVSTGRALSFVNGAQVTRTLVTQATQLQLSSERGPVLTLAPAGAASAAAGPGAAMAAGGYPGPVRSGYSGGGAGAGGRRTDAAAVTTPAVARLRRRWCRRWRC